MRWIRREQAQDVTSQKLEVDFHFKDDDNLSVTDEGGQNSRDGAANELIQNSIENSLSPVDQENIPVIKIKRKRINKEKFKSLISDRFQDWFLDSKQVTDTYFLKNYFEKNEDVEVLLFEDFNTLVLKVDQFHTTLKCLMKQEMIIMLLFGMLVQKWIKEMIKVDAWYRKTYIWSFLKINTFFVYTKQNLKIIIILSLLDLLILDKVKPIHIRSNSKIWYEYGKIKFHTL